MTRTWPDPTPRPRKMPKANHGKKPPAPPPRQGRNECCPMVAAAKSARQGRFRLACRYAGLAARMIGRRVNDACGLDFLRA